MGIMTPAMEAAIGPSPVVQPVPGTVVQKITDTTTTLQAMPPPSWLSSNLRNILALALCAVVCWLAWNGHEQAQASLVAAFTVLCGAIWGERAALRNSQNTPEK